MDGGMEWQQRADGGRGGSQVEECHRDGETPEGSIEEGVKDIADTRSGWICCDTGEMDLCRMSSTEVRLETVNVSRLAEQVPVADSG